MILQVIFDESSDEKGLPDSLELFLGGGLESGQNQGHDHEEERQSGLPKDQTPLGRDAGSR